MQTTLITEPPVEREPKAVHAVVVRTRNLVIAAILVALFASSAGVISGVVAAQAFDTPGPRGAQGAQGVAGVDGERGPRGYRGKRGRAGKNGANGANGVNGATVVREEACSNDLDVPLPYC